MMLIIFELTRLSFIYFLYLAMLSCSVVTLEDVLEELLQEEIFDEKDQTEKEAAEKIALWAGRRWRRHAKKVRSMASVVEEAARESTALLGNPQEKRVSVFDSIIQGLRFSKIEE